MDPYDALNPEDDCIDVTRIEGVTTVQTVAGTRSVINGTSVVLNLEGTLRDDLVLKRDAAQIFNMGAKTPGRYPSTLPGVVAFLEDKLNSARDYMGRRARAASKKEGSGNKGNPAQAPFKRDLEMEALARVLEGKVPALFLTYDEVTLRNALKIIEDYGLEGILLCRDGILKYADRLAEKKIPVIWAGAAALPERWEPYDANYHTAAVLEEKGLAFAFDSGGGGAGNRNVRNLPVPAAISVAHGLSLQAALEAITINPARILGVDDEVGSLEVGKLANLAIWSGCPMQMRSRVLQVIIKGELIPMTSHQTRLRDKFSKIVEERSAAKKK
jgi:imidazolonepropionase-like amidohydrolase